MNETVDELDLGILSNAGLNVDRLGHDVYAKALANQIEIIKPPLTIGLFARWGSGKSFLLQQIQSKFLFEPRLNVSYARLNVPAYPA